MFILLTVLLFGCSTKKNTFITRSYHNVTAHYNAYFNGNESLKAGLKKIESGTNDNYSILLPVFAHSNKDAASQVLSEMDKAIKKASKVIKLHSITVRPKRVRGTKSDKQKAFYARKEFCNWVDDSYLMLGMAHFYKHDFNPAIEAFEFVIKEFKDEPAMYDGIIWLARSYNEQAKFEKARAMIDLAEGDDKFPPRLMEELSSTYADYYLKQTRYSDAIPKLELAIKYAKKKKHKVRYLFILAQIHQETGDLDVAYDLYGQVVKMNPVYEMAFKAKINRATSFSSESGKAKEITKQLNKMLKDDKNLEYQDQIYFALGKIAQKEGRNEDAISDYKLSALKSAGDENQKAITYLELGDIYFARPDYKTAQAYYDSSIALLDKNFPHYSEIEKKAANLTSLVEYFNIVQLEDSLQKVAKMSEKNRLALIDGIIKDLRDEEARQKKAEQENRVNSALFQQDNQQVGKTNVGGKWYFYNPTTVGLGQTEFVRKWGNRKLEDNWRRKNKAIVDVAVDEENGTENPDSVVTKKVADNKTRQYYLQDLPMTDSLMAQSHDRIEKALYELAKGYKEKLNDNPKSIETYLDLLKRYPETIYLLSAYYQLYSIYKEVKNNERAEYYRNLIIEKFPDSKYAMILKNPNYFKELEAQTNEVETYYKETYNAYVSKDFQTVISNSNHAINKYSGTDLESKFFYIKAISYGESGNKDSLSSVLTYLVKAFPESSEKAQAQEILKRMGMDLTVSKVIESKVADSIAEVKAAMQLYTFEEKAIHFYVVIADNSKTDANRLKFNLSNYNIDNYSMIDFNVSSILLSDKLDMITVKTFDNKEQALNYYNAIITKGVVYKDLDAAAYRHFVITSDNYKSFYKDKDISKYQKFFSAYYLSE